MNPVQKLITDNRIEEAIEKLLVISGNDSYLNSSVQQLKSRYSKLKKDSWDGTLSKEESDLERNRITNSLLEISKTVDFERGKRNKKVVFGVAGIGIVLLALGIIFYDDVFPQQQPIIDEEGSDSIPSEKPESGTTELPPIETEKPAIKKPEFKLVLEGENMTGLFESCLKAHFEETGFSKSFKVDYSGIYEAGEERYNFNGSELKLISNGIVVNTGIQLKEVRKVGGLSLPKIKEGIMEDLRAKLENRENIETLCEKLKTYDF